MSYAAFKISAHRMMITFIHLQLENLKTIIPNDPGGSYQVMYNIRRNATQEKLISKSTGKQL